MHIIEIVMYFYCYIYYIQNWKKQNFKIETNFTYKEIIYINITLKKKFK